MIALFAVTLIWAFSFTLVGHYLRAVDPALTAAIRLILATLCLLPFLRWSALRWRGRGELLMLGALQFGVMYVCYLAAFRHLEPYLVALFSIFTPIWVSLLAIGFERRGWLRPVAGALLAVAGAWVIRGGAWAGSDFLKGFVLMQVANFAFAAGQVWFRQWKFRNPGLAERDVFAWPLLGGALLAVGGWLLTGEGWVNPAPVEWLVLVYLGVVASGLGFFLWNYGASRVSAGFLAAANNLVVPLAVVVAFAWGGRPPTWAEFLCGSLLIAAALAITAKRTRFPLQQKR